MTKTNFKVSFCKDGTNYYMNKGTTVCTLKFYIKGLDELLGILPGEDFCTLVKKHNLSRYYNHNKPFQVIGITKKHSEDVYSEEIGMHIAETKAKRKAYRFAKNILKDAARILFSDWQNIHLAATTFSQIEEHETRHLDTLVK